MSKHTQEEWGVEPDGDHLIVSTNLLEICTIQPVDRGGVKSFYLGDETIANARLIAASPKMFAAFERILSLSDGEMRDGDAAREIAAEMIREARGES